MSRHLVAGLGLSLALLLAAAPAMASGRSGVDVTALRVDDRHDEPLGIDDGNPLLSWQMTTTHPCRQRVCPADRQTAYQIQAATGEADLRKGRLIWDSGKVRSAAQTGVRYSGRKLGSRDRVVWRVRVWDADARASDWSRPASWEMGLLQQSDWGSARWIDYPGRTEGQPMPIFARQFTVGRDISQARLYLSGVGLQLPTLNGNKLTDEVLAPGNSNYQLSSEYRTYDITERLNRGDNTLGVQVGNGPAYVRRSVTNPAVGRNTPYSWWQSQLKGSGVLTADAAPGATVVQVDNVANYHVGGTVNIDTGNGGDNLESRTITSIASTGITFTPALSKPHTIGAAVTGSGNNIAASDPSAGAAVTPRLIARLEISYANGKNDVIVSDRSWRTALGPLVTDAWYSGADYDARREQPGWDLPRSDLSATAKRRDGSAMAWGAAGFAPPPNLATKLVARTAEPVKVAETFTPVSVTSPVPGTWVFDFGQNMVGWPRLNLDKRIPAGTTIRVAPAESLAANGTVDQASLMGGGGSRGTDLFNTYTTAGSARESWHPEFSYFGMQWVQVTGLPEGYVPAKDMVTGIRLQADTPMRGNVALKTPVYDWGYSGRFGDEINWGNAIILVPSMLYEMYGDTETMARYYGQMVAFADYIQRQKASPAHIVDAALADWISAEQTSGRITGTWGYYVMISKLATMAGLTGHQADAEKYRALAQDIRTSFNTTFYNTTLRRYTAGGNAGTAGATQAAQALALDAGLVPDSERPAALVELVYAFHPNGDGPHFSGGTIGMASTVRALAAAGRDDVLWELLQEDDQPSYGYFMQPTTANPNGMTTIGENWNRGASKNHMILAQIEEWFHTGLAGIRTGDGRSVVVQPKPVGDLTQVTGSFNTAQGAVRSEWSKTDRSFRLTVEIPPNTTAEVWVPVQDGRTVLTPGRAEFLRKDGGYWVYRTGSGSFTFSAG